MPALPDMAGPVLPLLHIQGGEQGSFASPDTQTPDHGPRLHWLPWSQEGSMETEADLGEMQKGFSHSLGEQTSAGYSSAGYRGQE